MADNKYMNATLNFEEDGESDNPWDDTLLIKAYDRAVNLAKANMGKTGKAVKNAPDSFKTAKMECSSNVDPVKEPKRESTADGTKNSWKVGSKCRSVWSQDGIEYEAEIVSIKLNKNQARVRFVGYNNEENAKLSSLKPSNGEDARQKQISDSQTIGIEESYYFTTETPLENPGTSQTGEGMMFPPPPPPHILSYLPQDEQEALSAMLMSWYMSGYHTGYYQGLLVGRKTNTGKKK